MSRTEPVPSASAHALANHLRLRDALRWLGIALLVVASLVVIGAFLLMPVVPALSAGGA